MGGGEEREKRDVRGREQAGALKNIKNRNGDWSAHSSDWVKTLIYVYLQEFWPSCERRGSGAGVGRPTLALLFGPGALQNFKR